jgi:ABC-type Fe3+-siderophore transport system permease subunit
MWCWTWLKRVFILPIRLYNTKDAARYSGRLLGFAVLSQLPFMAFFNTLHQVNILFTLWAGLMLLMLQDGLIQDFGYWQKVAVRAGIGIGAIGFLFQPYSVFGPLSVYVAGRYLKSEEGRAGWLLALVIVVFLLNISMSWLMCLAGTVSLLVIYLVSRIAFKWPRIKGVWLYWFYPVHLLVVYLLVNTSSWITN